MFRILGVFYIWEVSKREEQLDTKPRMQKESRITLVRGGMNKKEGQGWNFEEQLCWGWVWSKGEEFMKNWEWNDGAGGSSFGG